MASNESQPSLDRFLATDIESEEAEDFSSQMLLDDEAFERALAEEDDLIDAAVRGELDAESEQRIRNFLGTLPEAGERLAFARELAAVLDSEPAQPEDEDEASATKPSLWKRLTAWLRRS